MFAGWWSPVSRSWSRSTSRRSWSRLGSIATFIRLPPCQSATKFDPRIASPGMLLNKFPPMTGATTPNRVGVVDGGKDQHGREVAVAESAKRGRRGASSMSYARRPAGIASMRCAHFGDTRLSRRERSRHRERAGAYTAVQCQAPAIGFFSSLLEHGAGDPEGSPHQNH